MCSISAQTPCINHHHTNPIYLRSSSPSILSFPSYHLPIQRLYYVLNTKAIGSRNGSNISSSSSEDGYSSDLLRKPVVVVDETDDEEEEREKPEQVWVDWEDQILEDTVPLVGFVRMILHSGKYANGDRLTPEHEKTIIERLLPHHPQYEEKIGNGLEYIITGNHPDYEDSRCLFIVRKDGEVVDFSFWKCIKGLIKKKYPLYADSFILRHLRRRPD